jgi:DNA-binding CsgD family transcriptional regulator
MVTGRGKPRGRFVPRRERRFRRSLMTMRQVCDRPRPGVVPGRGRACSPRELVGREQDLAIISAFVAGLAAQGGALLLSGEPGIGKSALLDAAETEAVTAGARVLRAAGAEFEDMSFGGLNQLLLPLRDALDQLDGWQRDALNFTLGFGAGPAPGRLVVSNAVLALLEQAGRDRPLLLVVDSLQWVDPDSARVLGSVARRLRGSGVGLIAAERTGASRLPALDLPGYDVRALAEDASARLLAARFPGLAPAVRRRIVAEAGGNALALLELPAGLSDSQRSGLGPLPTVLPLSGRLRALASARVAALPATAGYLLLLAVLEGTGDLSVLLAAAAGHCEISDLASAERVGLVRVDEAAGQVLLSHQVIRSAVLERSAPDDVRRAHLALAAQLRGQPERRAWHLAGAGIEPDGGVTSMPARVPRPRPDRGDADQERRLAAAAHLAVSVYGDLGAAEALLAQARRACPDPGRSAEIAVATALVLLHGDGDVAAAHRLLLRGLETAMPGGAGPLSASEVLEILVTVGRLSGRAGPWEAADPRTAGGRLDSDVGLLARGAEPAQIVQVASETVFADRLADCRQALRRIAGADAGGRVGTPAMQAGILLALEAYQTGQWDEAWRLAETAAALCASRGYQLLRRQAQTVLAFVAASRGDAGTAQALTDEITRWAAPRGIISLQAGAQHARVLQALAQSDFPAAYDHAIGISPAGNIPSGEPFPAWALLDLVEATLRTGRRGDADAHVRAARQAALPALSPRMALLCAAAMAMTATDDEAPALFDLALASEDAGQWPFDRARVHLLYGERLRRMRAVTTARVHLAAAHETFRRLGASPWASRAASELRAAGEVRQRADSYDYRVLTPQELQIATLAAAGLSNKEIGGRLFMSHRTVASHLYRMYPKLGITSRAALGRLLAQDEGVTAGS